MLLYLHGSIKNAGDFLIRQRGLELVAHVLPEKEIRDQPRWDPFPSDFDVEGVVLGGGPALRPDLKSVYPHFVNATADSGAPYAGLALGWAGKTGFGAGRNYFETASRTFLERIAKSGGISVRDNISADLLETEGISRTMTGCVAWYDIGQIDVPLHQPTTVSKLAFTPPAQPEHWKQSLTLLRQTAKQFPDAEKICVFHRGIWPNEHTGRREAAKNAATALVARQSGYRVIDAAYGTAALEEYRTCDLHVGYRVHAHLFCLAARRPSFLIEEDGRGEGQATTLHPELRFPAGAPDLARSLRNGIDGELSNGVPKLKQATLIMRSTWPTMQEFVEKSFERS